MPVAPTLPAVDFSKSQPDTEDLLQSLLAVSLTGIVLLRPVYAADGTTLADLAYVHLNPAAQQQLGLPARPAATLRQLQPKAVGTGLFGFYCDAFYSGQPGYYQLPGVPGAPAAYLQLAARRSGGLLLVSLAYSASQCRTAAEATLRAGRARELVAQQATDHQRQQLHDTFMQAPAIMCILAGPEHVFELVNPLYQQLVGQRPLLGRPIREAMPELADQGLFDLLDQVYRTGETFRAIELPVQLDYDNVQPLILPKRYYSGSYQALRNDQGLATGILVFAYDVTEQVLARQRLEASEHAAANANEELTAANEELQAANAEIVVNNTALFRTQHELRQLAHTLEQRVSARTAELGHAQQAAEWQRLRLERFFMQAPAAICILDGPALVFELVNPRYQQLFPGRQLLGKPLLAALPELADQPVWHSLHHVYRTGETHEAQEVMVRVAKHENEPPQELYFNYIQQARYDEQGRLDGVLVFAFEVTEQVLAQRQAAALQTEVLAAAQRQAQEREAFHQVFEQTPAIIAILREPQHRLAYYNPAYGRLFAGRLERGRPIAELQPEAVAHGYVALLNRVYCTGETYHGLEVALPIAQSAGQLPQKTYFDFTYQPLRENGQVVATGEAFVAQEQAVHLERNGQRELVYLNFVYQPLRDVYGLITSVSVVATDVSEQVAARQQLTLNNTALDRANQQLSRTNSDLDTFIYTASHDLKAPISNIEGLLVALREELTLPPAEADVPLLLDLMQGSVERFKRTIADLTEVSKLQKAQQQPTATVELAALAEAVRLDLRPLFVATGGRLVVETAACPTLAFAEKNLRSVVYNLLSNALKYHHPDRAPLVQLRTYVAGPSAVLAVQDNGLGIDPARQHKLFGMFQRLHDHVEGSGIGLYMVKKIIDNAGGRIEIDSQLGVGSTFRIYLPR